MRPTLRFKLTVLYGSLFLAAGALLLIVNYALVSRGLHAQTDPERARVGVVLRQLEPAEVPMAGPGTLVTPDGRPLGDVLQEYEADLRNDTLHAVLVQSSIALGVMAVAAVGLGWMVAGRALRPLQDVTAAARRLSEANLHERLALQGPRDELKELADTFDGMLERLERAFESQRRFVANASHELRTPLTIQRTLVEVALADSEADERTLREMAVAVEAAIGRSQRLIDSLLVLARSEQEITATEPVDVADAAALAMDHARVEAGGHGISLSADLHPAPMEGTRVLIERLVANLVENAVRHNHSGGWVRIETGTDGDARTAWVRVTNSGPVVAAEQVAGLFEPFRRLGHDRVVSQKGAGLGLSIVRAVAAAHRGRVATAARAEGGLDIIVTLPRRDGVSGSGENQAPVRPEPDGEQSIPWSADYAAPTARRPASVGSGGGAASPTSIPAATR
ncbi:MAG: HAMP domain-containing histidine kinase [Actinomycetota bacterium]|nr:HAMP domain-containing histidine kinase [Actinomycetota bacterium]